MKCPSCGIENLEDSKFCRKCATALPGGEASFTRTIARGPAEFAAGAIIGGHYKITRILGRGGPPSGSLPLFNSRVLSYNGR
jgi:hypothetical protein